MKEQAIMGVRQLLEGLDINLETKGMTDTPKRVATLFEGLFSGCHSTGKEALGDVSYGAYRPCISESHPLLFDLRTSFNAFLWQSTYCVSTTRW